MAFFKVQSKEELEEEVCISVEEEEDVYISVK